MRVASVLIAFFLLAAFAIGISLADDDINEINTVLTNATIIATNFSLTNISENAYIEGGFRILEKFVQFSVVTIVEVMRVGILFGHDNPDYFTPEFIIGIARFLMWAMIISMLFVPMLYLLAFFIMFLIFIVNKIKERRKKHGKKTNRERKR